jgi:hypothetical protein
MLRRSLFVVLAFGLLTGVATASSSSLQGTYRTTITGKPAPLDGKWQLKFLSGSTLRMVRNGKLVIVANAIHIGNHRLRLSDLSGSYACSKAEGNGVYTYRLAGGRLTFRVVSDKCIGRKLVLTTKPFVK